MRVLPATSSVGFTVLLLTSMLLPVSPMRAQTAAPAQGAAAAGSAATEPAYLVRGRQTEVRQRAYHGRIDDFYRALSEALRSGAPDLLAGLSAPRSDTRGYQLLPRFKADAPPSPPGTTSHVVSFSWNWSDTLFDRETKALDRLLTELTNASTSTDRRGLYEKLVDEYRAIMASKEAIDADIHYNWHWQTYIAGHRSLFDRLQRQQEDVLEREAINGPMVAGGTVVWPNLPGFVRIERPSPHQWVVTVPVYTDVMDAGFVHAFQRAVEEVWHVREGGSEFIVRLDIHVVSPEQLYCGETTAADNHERSCSPPTRGAVIDLHAHVARFPLEAAVLTTGAPTLQLTAGRAIALAPYDVPPRLLAHEFGHVLGFPDAYFRGYRDVGTEGFVVTELADAGDIMGAPRTGPVLARHFERIVSTREAQELMTAGLDALYKRGDPVDAVNKFRGVLERNPTHYGATLQLAKAFDRSDRPEEARPLWRKMLEMAEAVRDDETAGTARTRLAGPETARP